MGMPFRTAAHTVRTQHGVTASAGQRHGDVEIWSYLGDKSGSWSLVFDLSIAHDRFGSSSHVQQNGLLSHPQDRDGPMRVAAQRKINAYRRNTLTIRTSRSPCHSVHIHWHPHARQIFVSSFSYRPTGRPRRTSRPLEYHRNATIRTRSVSSAQHSTSR
jgi:hypothetical protein